ncbi:RNA polymerase sigma factor [Alteriqipengyuania sp. 357]
MTELPKLLAKARRAVLRRGVASEDADEIVHEAFLKLDAYERQHEVRSREAMLVSTAVNLSIDRQRRTARAPFVTQENIHLVSQNEPDPSEVAEARARLKHLSAGLATLPERSRRILLMRRLDNLSYAKIAEHEGMSVAAVEKQVARATLRLMEWMDSW